MELVRRNKSGCILKVELAGFAIGLGMKQRDESRTDQEFLALV